MCSLNPQPHRHESYDPIKWDRRVPSGKMLVITVDGKTQVYGPGEAITEEMYSDDFSWYWPHDPVKASVVRSGMYVPPGKLLAYTSAEARWTFVGHNVPVTPIELKFGSIINNTPEEISNYINSHN